MLGQLNPLNFTVALLGLGGGEPRLMKTPKVIPTACSLCRRSLLSEACAPRRADLCWRLLCSFHRTALSITAHKLSLLPYLLFCYRLYYYCIKYYHYYSIPSSSNRQDQLLSETDIQIGFSRVLGIVTAGLELLLSQKVLGFRAIYFYGDNIGIL